MSDGTEYNDYRGCDKRFSEKAPQPERLHEGLVIGWTVGLRFSQNLMSLCDRMGISMSMTGRQRGIWIGIVCALLFSFFTFPASGAAGDIPYGSPRIDGEMDDLYRHSVCLTVQEESFYSWGNGSDNEIRAECRMLWDKSFLYLCTVVTDPAILSVGKGDAAGCRENDGILCWFTDGNATFSVQADPFGYTFSVADGTSTFDIKNAICAVRAYPESGYYVIEMALPFSSLEEGREIGISLQVNDLAEEGSGASYASSVICAENLFSLNGRRAESVTAPPESGNDSPVLPGPPTSDMLAVLVAVAVAAIVVLVLLCRRRK